MVKPAFTRTVNPLQFEALDPKRFEDLVRQLLYDFRPWRLLEPTGRLGTDDGFDVRGWEVEDNAMADATNDQEEDAAPRAAGDMMWLIQCKREREIGPTKLLGYLNVLAKEDVASLHGIIFAACADFSKRARDGFRSWCIEHGLREFFLWGKAELEDALFQSKNDRLLFAYFGLSLTIRRRSEQARLRSQTTIKRKLKRSIEGKFAILIRDVVDSNYPYTEGRENTFAWWVFASPRLTFRGLECKNRRYFAYIDDDLTHWDYANAFNDAQLGQHADPWRGHLSDDYPAESRMELVQFWDALPPRNKAWLTVWGVIPFDAILEVDEIGDDLTTHPHIYVTADTAASRPFEFDYPLLSFADSWAGAEADPARETRIQKFPAKFRKPLPFDPAEGKQDDEPT
jgi:hypothetical protein